MQLGDPVLQKSFETGEIFTSGQVSLKGISGKFHVCAIRGREPGQFDPADNVFRVESGLLALQHGAIGADFTELPCTTLMTANFNDSEAAANFAARLRKNDEALVTQPFKIDR